MARLHTLGMEAVTVVEPDCQRVVAQLTIEGPVDPAREPRALSPAP